jgi:ABC-type amino acid transport substrate-binding protein
MAAETPGPAHRFIPLVAMSMDMLVRRELEIDSVEQARLDPRVGFGIVDGLTYGPWGDRFLAQLPPARVDRSPSIDTIYRKLVANRVQATFGFSLNYQRNLDLDGLRDNVRIVPVPDAPRGVIGLKLFAAQLPDADAALLQKTAVEIRDDGTLERLLGHWVDHGLAHNLVWRTERDGPSSKP